MLRMLNKNRSLVNHNVHILSNLWPIVLMQFQITHRMGTNDKHWAQPKNFDSIMRYRMISIVPNNSSHQEGNITVELQLIGETSFRRIKDYLDRPIIKIQQSPITYKQHQTRNQPHKIKWFQREALRTYRSWCSSTIKGSKILKSNRADRQSMHLLFLVWLKSPILLCRFNKENKWGRLREYPRYLQRRKRCPPLE